MTEMLVLDARPVSQIVHPRKFRDIKHWFRNVLTSGRQAVIPEVVDYEVRRGLLRIPAPKQIDRLDGDAILIAQIRALGDPRNLTVITENTRHLKPFVPAMPWKEF